MKKIILLLALTAFADTNVRAATNFVILGDDFQAKIEAAAPGDTLVVQAGVYSGNLNFTKPLTVVRSGTNQLQFAGTVTVSTTGAVSILQSVFSGTVSVQTIGTLLISQSTCSSPVALFNGGTLQALDCVFPSLTATNGRVTLKRCNFSGSVTVYNTDFEGLRLNLVWIGAFAPTNSGKRFVLTQSYVTQGVSVSGSQCYLGYSSFSLPNSWNFLISLVDCDSVLVGNIGYISRVTDATAEAVGAIRGTIRAYNNRLYLAGDNWEQHYYAMYGFHLDSASGELVNNSIFMVGSSAYGIGGNTKAINVTSGGGPVIVRANAINQATANGGANVITTGVAQDGSQITQCTYNCIWVQSPPALSGVLGVSTILSDPVMNIYYDGTLSPANGMFLPLGGSPCINGGPPDAIYYDQDGSRNNIGHTGGPLWNPANYTNNNPMVFFLTGSPQTVLKGVQTNILVNVGASAGH